MFNRPIPAFIRLIPIVSSGLLLVGGIVRGEETAAGNANTYSIQSITQGPAKIVSPIVQEDGHVTFNLKAPNAKSVQLHLGEWEVKPQPMQRDAAGVWTVTVGPVPGGIYHYTFSVDGLQVIDPANGRVKLGVAVDASVVEVTSGPARVDQVTDAPKGILHVHTYRSHSLHADRRVVVYTPPGYTEDNARYPVLYLRHGGGDTEWSWSNDGRAHVIADNLIGEKKAPPMLIVMTNGMVDRTWAGSTSPEAMALLEEELLQDVVPLVDREYRTVADADHRAIAGLSMGGGHAFVMGLRNLDTFRWIGQFSSGLLADKDLDLDRLLPHVLDAPAVINTKVHLLYIACGESDPRFRGHEDLVDKLRAKGLHPVWHQTPGGHEWTVWRTELAQLLPRLFVPLSR